MGAPGVLRVVITVSNMLSLLLKHTHLFGKRAPEKMQELPGMIVQLAISLETMTHTERIIYYTVGGCNYHPKACCSVLSIKFP